MKKVAVVILNWNGKHYLEDFLPSVVAFSLFENTEVVVIDNGSTDDSIDFLKKEYDQQVRIVQLDANYGFTGGYNRGLQEVSAEYVVLLNSDVEVTPDWLSEPIKHLDEHPKTVACQPKILSYQHRDIFEFAGACGGYIDTLGFPFCRGRIVSYLERDEAQYDEVKSIFWATGACLFIRLADFLALGGFDESFFAHMEEIDLCWRIKSRGGEIVCVPQSAVYHLGGGTLNKENPQKTYLNYRNNLLLLYKNILPKDFCRVFFLRFFLDYAAAFIMLLQMKPKNSFAVIRARIDYHKMRKGFQEKRKANIQATKVLCIPEIYKNSILVDFFFKKKSKFSQLLFK